MLNELKKIKELYNNGVNIIDFLKNKTTESSNSVETILISYDMQAGSYVKLASERKEYINNYSAAIASILQNLGNFDSLMEVGVGEATTFANVLTKLPSSPSHIFGFDISWSRIKYANNYMQDMGINNSNLFTGDLFNIPIRDSSIDIVYTSHSIEPNGGREKEALEELYRITKKYLILLEPSFEHASDEGKERMRRLGYVQNLPGIAKELGYKIIENKKFDYSANPLNPTGLIIIEKKNISIKNDNLFFACPLTKADMEMVRGSYYCKDSLLVYPIIDNIPCLLSNNAIVASHYL